MYEFQIPDGKYTFSVSASGAYNVTIGDAAEPTESIGDEVAWLEDLYKL